MSWTLDQRKVSKFIDACGKQQEGIEAQRKEREEDPWKFCRFCSGMIDGSEKHVGIHDACFDRLTRSKEG